uniref:Myb-like domain-containing protein n=1 Tax=Oryza brachyantha TaxID=4533 RepID=J3MK95_ORYBR
MDPEVNMASSPPAPAVPRSRFIVRLKLPPAPWTPEEDALLQRLAKENRFRRWSRIARSMRLRSARKEKPAGAEDADNDMVEIDKESWVEPESQGRLGLANALARPDDGRQPRARL